MLFMCFALLLSIIPTSASRNIASLPNCGDKNNNQGWILVNTLDGKLSALDFHDDGNELWSIETGPGPMLSSNIDRLELSNNGHWVRIIPSLTGSLYKFNGDTIDAIPITADSLLTTSFRYLDDLVIAGGKEVRTYGLILNSGKLLYECSLDGCKNKTDHNNFEDLILLERNTQTVRAVEPRSGLERWNFSVGQLNIKFPQSSCHSDLNGQSTKFNMKAVVPEGLVYAFGTSNQVLWKKQFTSPIVNVWTWDGTNFKSIDLFSDLQYSWGLNTNNISPALYIGMHNKQLYIHESVILQKFLTSNQNKDRNELMEINSVSQIPWKPFPAKSSALSIIDVDKNAQTQLEELDGTNQIATTALSVLYASEYVNGNGFYLYTSEALDKQNKVQCEHNITIEHIENNENVSTESDEDDTPVQVIIVSLWFWWKEVTVIAIGTAFAFNLIINQHIIMRRINRDDSRSQGTEESNISSSRETIQNIPLYIKSNSESSNKEFISRYLNDFEPLHCLGKGGFGVVFEARNIIDECSYAVKRITLPNKSENRERVMREVKALAKLDHRNIVRYFQAWVEAPPTEWIDFHDKKWKQDANNKTDGFDFSTTKSPPTKKIESSVVIDVSQSDISKGYSSSDFQQSEDMYSDSFIVFENSNTSKSQNSVQSDDESRQYSKSPNSLMIERSRTPQTVYNSNKMFLYIQMQLCRRESLRDWLRENITRSHSEIKSIFEQIVSAVEYVHLKGLIHRDLKPSNIFFSIDGEVKIGDFGLVTGMEECNCENIKIKHESDKYTRAVGTQLYMSPEQLNGLSYNYKVDIYSLGVILFELLVPFHTTMERIETLSNLRRNKFPKQFCQDFNQEYQLLMMMLSERPEERPTTYGIKARPPLGNSTDNCDYHFELPSRH